MSKILEYTLILRSTAVLEHEITEYLKNFMLTISKENQEAMTQWAKANRRRAQQSDLEQVKEEHQQENGDKVVQIDYCELEVKVDGIQIQQSNKIITNKNMQVFLVMVMQDIEVAQGLDLKPTADLKVSKDESSMIMTKLAVNRTKLYKRVYRPIIFQHWGHMHMTPVSITMALKLLHSNKSNEIKWSEMKTN